MFTYDNINAGFENTKNIKYRTILHNWKSIFERNTTTEKLQLSKATLKGKIEVFKGEAKDIFDFSYMLLFSTSK